MLQKEGNALNTEIELWRYKTGIQYLDLYEHGFKQHDEKYELHRLIGTLLSSGLKEQEKLDIIEHEYNIPVSNEIREDVRVMCNLSAGIEERAEERATEKTSEKFILNMYKKGYTLEQIADVAEISVDAVEAVIQKKAPVMA